MGGDAKYRAHPLTSGPVPIDTTFHYDVAVTDNNIGFCPGTSYDLFLNSSDPGITTNVFLAGSVFNDLVTWSGPGIANDDARFHASLNTCNGCHGPEVNTTFLQITPRSPGSTATLSPFLTGTTVVDSAGQQRTVNDLGRRKSDLTSLVCPPSDAGPPVMQDAAPPVAPDAGAP